MMRKSLMAALLFSMLVGLSMQQDDGACTLSKTVQGVADFEDIKDCSSILGLTIQAPGIEEINLPNLKTVNGPLIVEGCANTKKINIPLLTAVDGDFQIISNPLLETISVPTPFSVTQQTVITDNGNLQSINVAVTTCTDVIIQRNRVADATTSSWNLTLPALTSASSFSIQNNTGMIGASVAKLATVTNDFQVSENAHMVSFSAPTGLTIGASATIATNPVLADLTFNPLSVKGTLSFEANGLNGVGSWNIVMDSLTTVDLLEIKTNYHLSTISLQKLNRIAYTLAISNNPNLVSVNIPGPFPVGLDLLIANNQGTNWDLILGASYIGQEVSITKNTGINILSLNKVENIGGNMVVTENTVSQILANNKFPIRGEVSIISNTGLTMMDLDGLYSCDSGLSFINNKGSNFPILLDGLHYITENLNFNSNAGVTMISMQSLEVIGASFSSSTGGDSGSLSIFDNPALGLVTANASQFTIRSELIVTNNPLLRNLDLSGLVRIGSSVTISKNGLNVINLSGLKCASTITLADNAGIKTVTMTSVTTITDSILFSPAVVSGCNMCVGSGSSDCARCGACLACASNSTCGSDNSNWKDVCSTNTASCPVIELPVITVTQPSDVPTDVPSDYTLSFSTSDSNTRTNTGNTATETIPEDEGAAVSIKVTGTLVALALLGNALL